MNTKRAAGFLIFRRRLNQPIEYLLLCSRKRTAHWSPPKGHTELGDSDDFATALRETREETGYREDDLKIYRDQRKEIEYEVKGKDKTVVYWLAELRVVSNDPKLSHEHTGFRWLPKDEAISLSGLPGVETLVQYFHPIIQDLVNSS